MVDVLRERGARHEQAYLEHLQAQGLRLVTIPGVAPDEAAAAQSVAAMRAGADAIVQAALRDDGFVGRADVLLKVERASALGPWSYEVVDTKLARETKGGTILQLSLYSELVARVQRAQPEAMHVVVPWSGFEPQTFRVADYAAFFRKSKLAILSAVEGAPAARYPEPCAHCDVCDWAAACEAQRRADDHLSFVAGISKLQTRELEDRGVTTLAALAALPLPLPFRPERGSTASLEKLREQARIQRQGRERGELVFELLPQFDGFGLGRLPEPSDGDVFLDFEGDPFVGESGLEYLVGYAFRNEAGALEYRGGWALTRHDERASASSTS
jgi:uncharacterized protein